MVSRRFVLHNVDIRLSSLIVPGRLPFYKKRLRQNRLLLNLQLRTVPKYFRLNNKPSLIPEIYWKTLQPFFYVKVILFSRVFVEVLFIGINPLTRTTSSLLITETVFYFICSATSCNQRDTGASIISDFDWNKQNYGCFRFQRNWG